MARKTVITGGSGRLGSRTVEAMIAAGYEVLNLDAVPPREKLCESWTRRTSPGPATCSRRSTAPIR